MFLVVPLHRSWLSLVCHLCHAMRICHVQQLPWLDYSHVSYLLWRNAAWFATAECLVWDFRHEGIDKHAQHSTACATQHAQCILPRCVQHDTKPVLVATMFARVHFALHVYMFMRVIHCDAMHTTGSTDVSIHCCQDVHTS